MSLWRCVRCVDEGIGQKGGRVQKTPTMNAPQTLTSSATLASTVDILECSFTRSSSRSQLCESGAKMMV